MTTTSDTAGNEATVRLKIKTTGARIVAEAGLGGNIRLARGGSIRWEGTNGPASYRVTFYDLASPDSPIWPLERADDGRDDDGAPFLRVTPSGVSTRLREDSPDEIKYQVEAEGAADVEPLDPIIIIRPPRV